MPCINFYQRINSSEVIIYILPILTLYCYIQIAPRFSYALPYFLKRFWDSRSLSVPFMCDTGFMRLSPQMKQMFPFSSGRPSSSTTPITLCQCHNTSARATLDAARAVCNTLASFHRKAIAFGGNLPVRSQSPQRSVRDGRKGVGVIIPIHAMLSPILTFESTTLFPFIPLIVGVCY